MIKKLIQKVNDGRFRIYIEAEEDDDNVFLHISGRPELGLAVIKSLLVQDELLYELLTTALYEIQENIELN